MKKQISNSTGLSSPNTSQRHGFVQNRLHNFGLTMVIMGASFALYYLGLFGSQNGPLNPAHMGITLHGWGITQQHVIALLVVLLAISSGWNWVYSGITWMQGKQRTCVVTAIRRDQVCGAPVERRKRPSRHSGRTSTVYVCSQGHQCGQAQFHPLRKGTLGHCLWIGCLLFLVIALFSRSMP